MSSFNYFTTLDEVAAFGDYLVKVEAIPSGGLLHLKTKPVKLTKLERNSMPLFEWSATVQRCFSHAANLADKFPDHYRSFKTLRRLTT